MTSYNNNYDYNNNNKNIIVTIIPYHITIIIITYDFITVAINVFTSLQYLIVSDQMFIKVNRMYVANVFALSHFFNKANARINSFHVHLLLSLQALSSATFWFNRFIGFSS